LFSTDCKSWLSDVEKLKFHFFFTRPTCLETDILNEEEDEGGGLDGGGGGEGGRQAQGGFSTTSRQWIQQPCGTMHARK